MNNLVTENLRVVEYHAKKASQKVPPCVSLDELKSAGYLGLVQASKTFDVTRGVKFTTYAGPRVFGAINDYLRDIDWIPRKTRQYAKTVGLSEEQSRTFFKRIISYNAKAGERAYDVEDVRNEGAAGVDKDDWWNWMLAGLSSRKRLIATLYYRESLMLGEIGQAVGVSKQCVYQNLQAIVKSLKLRMKRAI